MNLLAVLEPADGVSAPAPRPRRMQRKDEVRARVFAAAIPLFLEHGFDGVTMEDIAAASGVPRRTIFRHFPSKTDVVHAWTVAANDGLAERIAAQPQGEPLTVRLCGGILEHVRAHPERHDRMLKMGMLSASTPDLRARAGEKFEIWSDDVARQIARERGRADPSPAEQLAVALVMAAYRVVTRRWIDTAGQRPVDAMLAEAFAHLRPIRFHDEHAKQE